MFKRLNRMSSKNLSNVFLFLTLIFICQGLLSVASAKEKKKKAPKTKKVAVPKSDKNDDLKAIKGIGPKLEEVLGTIGFTAYEQLAKLSIKDLTKLLSDAGINTKMYDLSSWKKQAKALATA